MDKEKEKKTAVDENTEREKQSKQEGQSTEQPNLDDQMLRRQSAPRPTAEEEAKKIYQQQQGQMASGGAINGFKALIKRSISSAESLFISTTRSSSSEPIINHWLVSPLGQ